MSLRRALAEIETIATTGPLPRSVEQTREDEADRLRRIAAVAVDALAEAGELVIPFASDGPRTWSLPAEPGPEVTAVSDARGGRWTRLAESWMRDDQPGYGYSWHSLLGYGPLTDLGPLTEVRDGD